MATFRETTSIAHDAWFAGTLDSDARSQRRAYNHPAQRMMPSRIPAAAVCSGALLLAVSPTGASAQAPFLDAVRELAGTAVVPDANTSAELRQRRATALARMQTALTDWDRHIETLARRVTRERDAGNDRVFQLHVELGLAYRQRGRFDDALRELDAAARMQPGASDIHVLRALTFDAAGRPAEAGAAYRTAWRRDAADPVKAYLALRYGTGQPEAGAGERALDTAQREQALDVLREALERLPARDAAAGEAPFLVLDAVPDALSRAPIVGDAAMAAVFARLAEGRLDGAMSAAAGAATRTADPGIESPRAALERGRADESEGRYDAARRAYTAALAGTLAGRHVLYVGLGRLSQVDGDLDAAIEAFTQAARLSPNDPVIHRELAAAYAAAGKTDDAFAELVAALLIDPRNADALTAVGQFLLETDRAADAIAVLNRAVAADPGKAEAHYALAMALARAGRAEDAARQFERFERLSRDALQQRRRAVTGQAAPPAGQ